MKRVPRLPPPETGWIEYRLFYHEDRDRALRELITPAVGGLWRVGWIDSFFFVRYTLGGPHLRLRVRVCAGHEEETSLTLERTAAEFLARCPSTAPWSEDRILRQNRILLANDSEEKDCGVAPDNNFSPVPVHFEIERYGGLPLFEASLDFFAVSSAVALRFLGQHAETPPSRRMPVVLRILARQAFGSATSGDDLLDLIDYASGFGSLLASLASRGDEVFEAQREAFRTLLKAEWEILTEAPSLETEAACRLRQTIAGTDADSCRRIVRSHLHMTANRLGLLNPEEVYIGRLLWRSVCDLAERDPSLWNDLCEFLSSNAKHAARLPVDDLLVPALTSCFGSLPFPNFPRGDTRLCSRTG